MTSVPCPFCGAEHTAGAFVCPTTNRRLHGLLGVKTVIDEKYRIEGIIGVGGMGVVYKAMQTKIHREVALKMLLPEYIVYPDLVARVEREARTAGQIDHPNVVSIVDLGITSDHGPYIAMELLRGQELATTVEKAGGRLDPAEAVEVMRQVLAGLDAAHKKGVIHRDLKPENIFLTQMDDGMRVVKVLDFGISKLRDDSQLNSLTRTGTVMGTPQFMAPEQAAGSRDQDARIDLYAAGAVLYAVLCNGLPYEAENYNLLISEILNKPPIQILERASTLDPRLAAIVMRSIAKKPDQRYQSARAMADALGAWYEIRNTPRTGSVRIPGMRPSLVGIDVLALDAGRGRGSQQGRRSAPDAVYRGTDAIVQYDDDLSPDDPAYVERGEATVVVPVPFTGEEHTDPTVNGHADSVVHGRHSATDSRPDVNGRPSLPPGERRSSPPPAAPDSDPGQLKLSELVKESPLDAPPIVLPPAPKPPPTDEAWERLRTGSTHSARHSALILDDIHPQTSLRRYALALLVLVVLTGGGLMLFRTFAKPQWHRTLQHLRLEDPPPLPPLPPLPGTVPAPRPVTPPAAVTADSGTAAAPTANPVVAPPTNAVQHHHHHRDHEDGAN